MPLRARAKTACEIARIDPKRFNEIVHAEQYPCAPATTPGSARIFDIDQIVALGIFGSLLTWKMAPEYAGHLACEAYAQFRDRDDVAAMVYMQQRNGASHMIMRTKNDDRSLPTVAIVWDIPELRKEVQERLEYEDKNRVVGED